MMQQYKDIAVSLQGLLFDPWLWPGNFHMPQMWPEKKKKKKRDEEKD